MTRFARHRLFLVLAALYFVAAGALAQDDDAYHVRALHGGGSTLREINGENVLEFPVGVRIIHGDVTITGDRGLHFASSRITQLIGNVVIVQNTVTMWGDECVYTGATDLAVLSGNVRIVDEGWEVTCDRARYSRTTGDAWLIGHVVAVDSVSTLEADSLFYNRYSERTEVFGNVVLTSEDEGFRAHGDHGFYFRNRGEAVIDRNPRLIVDPDQPEPITIVADTMRVYPDSSRAMAYYRVKIIKGNTVTQADSAVLYDELNRAELYGNPLARQDNVSMAGDRMTLHYDEDEVHRIDILGAAVIREEQRDSLVVGRDSWMQGDTVALYLHDNRVDSILVTNNASSEYFTAVGRKVEGNSVRGDELFFRFVSDSLSYVRVEGNASGVYRYLDLKNGQTADSLRAAADSTLEFLAFRDHAEKVVYSAARLEYFADSGDLVLNESAKVHYRNSELTGEDITYFSSLQLMDATGKPTLTENGEKFYGDRMNYDMESEAGLVSNGSTQFQEGYYTGDHVAKVSENEMKVWGSNYTTCDLKNPHYHFSSKEMKVYPKDKVITGPIWLYIGKTPIAYLPFMAANLRRGRRSGILRPEFEFGFDRGGGRYIRNWGYYWAVNDYMDYTFRGDFNEDREFGVFNQFRYARRYVFNGNIDYNFIRDLNSYLNEWTLQARHRHTLGERFSLNSDLRFVSSDEALKTTNRIDDVERVTEREIRSNVSVSKQWKTMGFSASATRSQKLNITDPNVNVITMTAPDVRLSIPSRNLYFGKTSKSDKKGLWEKLLVNTRYSPSLSGNRRYTEKKYEFQEVITINQGLSFQSPQKLGFLNVSPRLSARNTTVRTDFEEIKHTEVEDSQTVIIPREHSVETEHNFRWNTGASMSTNFFGTFYPNVGTLRGVRHKVSPSATWTYTPSIGNTGPARQSISLNMRQSLDLKVLKKKDNDRGERRGDGAGGRRGQVRRGGGDNAETPGDDDKENLQRLDGVVLWSLSTSYDPQAPSRQAWRNINSTMNFDLQFTSVDLRQTIDPYNFEVTRTTIGSRVMFRGAHPFGRSEALTIRELNVVAASDTSTGAGNGASWEQTGDVLENRDELAIEEGLLPWSMSMDLSHTKEPGRTSTSVNMRGQVDVTPTWSLSYRRNYDIEDRVITYQSYSITKDLHCWEMSFTSNKFFDEWQFYFKINLRAHAEIYVEQGQRGLGGGAFQGGGFGF